MKIEELLKEIKNSRAELINYVVRSLDKLNCVHSIDELDDEELFDNLLDKGICVPNKEDTELSYTVLGYKGNDLIVIESGIGTDLDSVEDYPLNSLSITELISLALDLSYYMEE